jgi:hypothetical protein
MTRHVTVFSVTSYNSSPPNGRIYKENPKHEIRNAKQIQSTNDQNLEQKVLVFEFGIFGFV